MSYPGNAVRNVKNFLQFIDFNLQEYELKKTAVYL